MGITAKTAPGLFRKGGLTDADNIVAQEHAVLWDNGIAHDANGYADQAAVIQAIGREWAGNPMTTAADADRIAKLDEPVRQLGELLDRYGIDHKAATKAQVREALGRADRESAGEPSGRALEQAINAGVDPDRVVKVVDITDHMMKGGKPTNLKASLKALIGQPLPTADQGRIVKMLPANVSHVVYSETAQLARGTKKQVHAASVHGLADLLTQATLIESGPNTKRAKKPNVLSYHRFYVPVTDGRRTYTVRIVAEQSKKGIRINPNAFHVYDIIPEEKGLAPRWSGSTGDNTLTPQWSGGQPLEITIRQMLTGVKDMAGAPYFQAAGPTDSPAFKEWFGDSKVVDADGKPLVVYHGTDKRFQAFDPKKGAQGIIWFTSDRAAIERGEVGASGAGRILELYATIKNPAGWKEYDNLTLDEIEQRGFDGVILPNKDGSFDGFAFEPTQLKSTHNRGTFDPKDPRILYQALRSRSKIAFTRKLDDLKAGKLGRDETLDMGPTPPALRLAGLPDLPMVYKQSEATKTLLGKHAGLIDEETLRRLPDLLDDPILVIKQENGRFAALIKDGRGQDVLTVIEPRVQMQHRLKNLVVTTHPKARPDSIIQAVRDGRVVYRKEKESRDWLHEAQRQLPGTATNLDFTPNIPTNADLVKYQGRTQEQPISAQTDARGSFDPADNTIRLFQKANLSTFLHESGHLWLHQMAHDLDDARLLPDARARIARGLQTVKIAIFNK